MRIEQEKTARRGTPVVDPSIAFLQSVIGRSFNSSFGKQFVNIILCAAAAALACWEPELKAIPISSRDECVSSSFKQ